jgi:hypothetical protein
MKQRLHYNDLIKIKTSLKKSRFLVCKIKRDFLSYTFASHIDPKLRQDAIRPDACELNQKQQ